MEGSSHDPVSYTVLVFAEENAARDNQSLGQNLYLKPLKYEAGVLIT